MLYGLSDDDLKNILQAFDLQQWEAGQQGDIFVRYLWMARFDYAFSQPQPILVVVSTDHWTKAIFYEPRTKTYLPAVDLRNWHDPVMDFMDKEIEAYPPYAVSDGHSFVVHVLTPEYEKYIGVTNPAAETALQFEDAVYQVEKQLYIEQLLQLGLDKAFQNRFLPNEKQQILDGFGLEAFRAGENNGLNVEYLWIFRGPLYHHFMASVIVVKTNNWLKLLTYDNKVIRFGEICPRCEGKGFVESERKDDCSMCGGRGKLRDLPPTIDLTSWADPIFDLILKQNEYSVTDEEAKPHHDRIFREVILVTSELTKPLITYVDKNFTPSIIGEAIKPELKTLGRRIYVSHFEEHYSEIIQRFQLEQLKVGQQKDYQVGYIWIVQQTKYRTPSWVEEWIIPRPIYAVLKSDQGFKATRLDKDGVVDLANWDDQVIAAFEASDITYFSSNWSSGNLPGYGYVLSVISSLGTHTVAFFNPTTPDLNRLERAIMKAMGTIDDLLG
jgi:hypothetical protein